MRRLHRIVIQQGGGNGPKATRLPLERQSGPHTAGSHGNAPRTPAAAAATPRLRHASATDFDLLCEIDADAAELFVAAGLDFESQHAHEFERVEQQRWRDSLAAGTCWIAMDPSDQPAGFAALSLLDTEPYLQQLSVRRQSMRRGLGTMLIAATARAALDAGHSRLWLTTYAQLPWNRPFYERSGFVSVPPHACLRELRAVLDFERRCLPAADLRIAMCKRLEDTRSSRVRLRGWIQGQ